MGREGCQFFIRDLKMIRMMVMLSISHQGIRRICIQTFHIMESIHQEYINIRQTYLDQVFWHLKQLCLSVASPNEVEGNYLTSDDMIPKQVNLYRFARNAKTALEIGFNAGHSAAIMLAANPELQLLAFDLGEHPYVRDCYEYLNEVFKGRIKLILGDSKETLPRYVRDNLNSRFDLIHIDGGHDYHTARSDILTTCLLANTYVNVVIADDDDMPELYKLHREVTSSGVWEPIKDPQIMTMPNESRHYIAHFTPLELLCNVRI